MSGEDAPLTGGPAAARRPRGARASWRRASWRRPSGRGRRGRRGGPGRAGRAGGPLRGGARAGLAAGKGRAVRGAAGRYGMWWFFTASSNPFRDLSVVMATGGPLPPACEPLLWGRRVTFVSPRPRPRRPQAGRCRRRAAARRYFFSPSVLITGPAARSARHPGRALHAGCFASGLSLRAPPRGPAGGPRAWGRRVGGMRACPGLRAAYGGGLHWVVGGFWWEWSPPWAVGGFRSPETASGARPQHTQRRGSQCCAGPGRGPLPGCRGLCVCVCVCVCVRARACARSCASVRVSGIEHASHSGIRALSARRRRGSAWWGGGRWQPNRFRLVPSHVISDMSATCLPATACARGPAPHTHPICSRAPGCA